MTIDDEMSLNPRLVVLRDNTVLLCPHSALGKQRFQEFWKDVFGPAMYYPRSVPTIDLKNLREQGRKKKWEIKII